MHRDEIAARGWRIAEDAVERQLVDAVDEDFVERAGVVQRSLPPEVSSAFEAQSRASWGEPRKANSITGNDGICEKSAATCWRSDAAAFGSQDGLWYRPTNSPLPVEGRLLFSPSSLSTVQSVAPCGGHDANNAQRLLDQIRQRSRPDVDDATVSSTQSTTYKWMMVKRSTTKVHQGAYQHTGLKFSVLIFDTETVHVISKYNS